MADTTLLVTGGVDTHKDFHVCVALDELGRVLGTEQSRRPSADIDRCSGGWAVSASSARSEWKAPARGVPGWPGF
jgi:formylmethanofuran dehydrogenase subunit A